MLFTITRDQYHLYEGTAGPCRQYILNRFSKLCSIVDTFNRYFGAENVDISADGFKQKSLLLTMLEDYEESLRLIPDRTLEEFLDSELVDDRVGIFSNLAVYVHWPVVTVTNERGQSVVVTDLYAKVPLWPNGRLFQNFSLSRATYSYEQYSSDYMHSHVSGIGPVPSSFMYPCLGTGPLIRTQETLRFNENSDLWDLFCVELDRYVHVESIAGVPYRRLDRIGTRQLTQLCYDGYRILAIQPIGNNSNLKNLFEKFFKYVLIQKKMKFGYFNGMFVASCSDTEWILKLSKEFLKFFAMMKSAGKTTVELTRLIRDDLLIEVKRSNNVLYNLASRMRGSSNYAGFNDLHVLYFKGEDIRTHVDEPFETRDNTYYVLNPVLALGFLDQCLNYLNIYEHEKSKNVIQDIKEEDQVVSGDTHDSVGRDKVKNTFPNYPLGEKRISLCS